jgi:two-component sensor histidine kinase
MFPSWTVICLLLTDVFLLTLAGIAWRFRTKPGAKLFGLLQILSAVWVGVTVLGLSQSPGSTRLRLWGVGTGLSLLVVVFWFGFILDYTGRNQWLSSWSFGLASLPLVSGAALYFVAPAASPIVDQVTQTTTPTGTVVEATIGPIGLVLAAYVYLVFLVGLGLVAKTVIEGSNLFVGQALAFGLGSMVTIVASFLVILEIPSAGYPLTQVGLGVQAVLWGYAVFGQQFLRVVPAVATIGERAVFDDLDNGVLVVEDDTTITRANPQARAYLGDDDLVGQSADLILERMGVSALADLPTRFQHRGRTYQATASPITNWRGESVGHALAIQDVTPLVRRQQRLQVLNRILRHNVRNNMAVSLSIAERCQHHDDTDVASMGETLAEKSRDMTTICEKAVEIDRTLDDPGPTQRVDLDTLVEDVVSPLAEQHSEATVRTAIEPETVETNAQVLSLVLREAVENALEHAGTAPEVTVAASRADGELDLIVRDDGPGIPRSEVEPIIAGEETALDHASSLGLWLVSWGTQSLGSEVDIDATRTGSEVTVSIPTGENRQETPDSGAITSNQSDVGT